MTHVLKLDNEYFDAIKSGIKTIELRLYDKKRRQIQVGDVVEFLRQPLLEEKIETRVVELILDESFSNILDKYPLEVFAGKNISRKELEEALNRFYSAEEQQEFGVVGIRIELI